MHAASRAGLYLHVPFCRRRCPFCDFAITTEVGRTEGWVGGLEREIELRAGGWNLDFDTIYLGGGTPSLLPARTVARILERLKAAFRIEPGAEVTLEANPGTLGRDDYAGLLDAGVNRLSLGVQSFDAADLEVLGRDHTVEESLEAYEHARRAGFRNVSVDLIYGLPGRDASHWRGTLARAVSLGSEHLSCYQLTYEPGTALTRRRDRGEVREPSEEEARELFLLTRETLEASGYSQYEVSSFARAPELQSRHNRKYWEGAPYLGLGPSAHSYRDGVRSWNARDLREYLAALDAGRDPEAGREVLDARSRELELLFLGLRTANGVRLDLFRDEVGTDLLAARGPLLAELERSGLAVVEGSALRLTPRGLAIADAVAAQIASPSAGSTWS